MLYSDFQKIASLLAKEHQITMTESNKWGSNIEKREVAYCSDDVADLPENQTMAFLLHEIAHIHYTTKWEKPERDEELTTITMEAIEDMAIENLISKDYTNAGEILEDTMKEVHSKMKEALPTLEVTKFEKAIHFAEIEAKNPGATITEPYEKAGKRVAEYLTKEKDKILNRSKTKNLLKNAEEIIRILKEELGEPTDQEKQQMQQRIEGAEGADGMKEGMDNQVKSNLAKGNDLNQKDISKMCRQIHAVTDQAHKVGRKLESILKSNNASKYEGRYRHGKLPNKRILRVRTANDKRPFTRKIEKNNKSYAFAINMDVSGSMFQGQIVDYAISGAYMTAKALKIAKIPRVISQFATLSKTIAKKELMPITWDDVAQHQKGIGGGTNTALAMEESITQLSKIQAERKVMIIITDGDDNNIEEITKTYKKAQKQGIECVGITVTQSKEYKYAPEIVFGSKNNINVEIRHAEEMGDAFCKIIKDKIKKYGD